MVNVTKSFLRYVRFAAIKFFFCHCLFLKRSMKLPKLQLRSVIPINLLVLLADFRIHLFNPFQIKLAHQRLVGYRKRSYNTLAGFPLRSSASTDSRIPAPQSFQTHALYTVPALQFAVKLLLPQPC